MVAGNERASPDVACPGAIVNAGRMNSSKPAGAAAVPHQQPVSWFELFYDLVIIAAVSQAGKVYEKSPTWPTTFLILTGVCVLLIAWLLTTLSHGTISRDIPLRRILVVIQMFAMLIAALSLGKYGLPNYIGLGSLAVVFASIAILYYRQRSWRVDSDLPDGLIATTSSIAAVLFLAAAWYSMGLTSGEAAWRAPVILAAIVAVVAVPTLVTYVRSLVRSSALDLPHLKERLGLLVIIVLGEQFMSLVAILGAKGSIPNPTAFGLSLVVAYSIWVLYFNSDLPRQPPSSAGRLRAWLALHALLVFGVVSVAAEFSSLTLATGDSAEEAVLSLWTPLPLLVVVTALAGLGWVGHANRAYMRIQVVAFILISAVTYVDLTITNHGPWYTSSGALILIADAVTCAIVRSRVNARNSTAESLSG